MSDPISGATARSRFRPAPPRRFLYPAILLLLAEEPRHGYRLVESLPQLGIGTMDRASVYRSLADLFHDGLIRCWDEPPSAGSTRHVYDLTPAGVEALEVWMTVVAAERATLDNVLTRFWYCNAHTLPLAAPAPDEPISGPLVRGAETESVDFLVATDRSSLTVEARSGVGPIAFSTNQLKGSVGACLRNGLVAVDQPPSGHLEVDLESLRSGNALYDSELRRRMESRRNRAVTVELTGTNRMGEGNCYEATGAVTLRGVTRSLSGPLTVTVCEERRVRLAGPASMDRRMTVTGEQVLDLRDFQFEPPAMPILTIYPDVRLHLHLEADALPAAE